MNGHNEQVAAVTEAARSAFGLPDGAFVSPADIAGYLASFIVHEGLADKVIAQASRTRSALVSRREVASR